MVLMTKIHVVCVISQIRGSVTQGQGLVVSHSPRCTLRPVDDLSMVLTGQDVATLPTRDGLIRETKVLDRTSGNVEKLG